jgi:hypothetical protein
MSLAWIMHPCSEQKGRTVNALHPREPKLTGGPVFSEKGRQLIKLYANMARDGYATQSGDFIKSAYNDFELGKFKELVQPEFQSFNIKTVLDYGCGGSDWEATGFNGVQSARAYFLLDAVCRYEPARDLDERQPVDAVTCFDVLEHIFVSDVPAVLRDILSLADRLAVLNVACYKANALLPNGENAHITARHPFWWKGMLDSLAPEFPDTHILLFCSTAFNKSTVFPLFSDRQRQTDTAFDIEY